MRDSEFTIDFTETFPHLNKAPIVEAVIDVRTRAEAPWEEVKVTERLKAELPDYPSILSMNAMQQRFTFGVNVASKALERELGWSGLRLQSGDKLHVASFERDGFVLGRLYPYETWEKLEGEAKRLWRLYVQVARPTQVQRLGVRFINRIPMAINAPEIEKYIQPHPESPKGLDLPFINFLHRETLIVPGYEYGINITRTLHIPQDRMVEGIAIILDIDVFTRADASPLSLDEGEQERRLKEMRWLKNKTFFGTITPEALENFR